MNTAPTIRLHLYFAQDADIAVILRQGPTRQFRMILWHLADDQFEDGQWIKQKVYPERCALSPDGRHFLSFILDGQWGSAAKGSYTVISRAPWFTALALYPQGDTWGGGGYFLDAQTYVIASAPSSRDIIGAAAGMARVYQGPPSGKNEFAITDADGRTVRLSPQTQDRLLKGTSADPRRKDYETDGGKLYRRDATGCVLIRDFTDMAFAPILAPYGDITRQPEGWHPLDADR